LTAVSVARLVRLASLVVAMGIALGGQLRAVDLIDLDDGDTITVAASDEFIATTAGKVDVPPRPCGALQAVPVSIGAGRIAVVRLFRPPQVA
jgi:hypothetical protein